MLDKLAANNRLEQLDAEYQLVIIGGGVYGAALCWEAAHRGIKTLLVEQEDYACGASSNSLKTIHGGLRSLQSLNLKAVIKGIRERAVFLQIAPNYVKPLPCILPTTGLLMKSRLVVGMGLLLYNILDKINVLFSKTGKDVPRARLLSRSQFIHRAPEIDTEGITGGALWYDAQVQNTERLVWQFIKAAISKGAAAINHTVALKHEGDSSSGKHKVLIRDALTGLEKTVTATAIIDCSAAWNFVEHCQLEYHKPRFKRDEKLTFLKSVNIIVKKNLFDNAVGKNIKAEGRDNARLYFFAPWREHTIIGTWYSSVESYPENSFSHDEAVACIDELNVAFNQKRLSVDDICNVHIGFLPAEKNRDNDVFALDKNLLSRCQFKDWSATDEGMRNVYSLRGTKYTLARYDAKQVVDELAKKMQWKVAASQSNYLPIYQAASKPANTHSLSDETVRHLLTNYGADIEQLFAYIEKKPQSVELIAGSQHHIMAEIYYAVFYEQALTLSDLLKRRLDLGDCSPPKLETAQYCANVMQKLLLWTDEVMHAQISALYSSYPEFLSRKINGT